MEQSRYKSALVAFMSFKDGVNYSADMNFSEQARLNITPEQLCRWMNHRAYGSNPTRSEAINQLIKTVKRFEVRREGVLSSARRPIEYDEFRDLLTFVQNDGKQTQHYKINSVFTLQWHLIARVDDMMKLRFENISPNVQNPDILDGPRFRKLKKGNLGTHSLRKGAATYGSRSGVSKDYINRRGRWRTRKSVVDVYIDNTLPYPDAMAAATLTGPLGPCFYFEKPGVRCVTTTLLVDKIAKCIKGLMGESVAKTLGLVLLWAALEPKSSYDYELLPENLRHQIIQAYQDKGGNSSVNPVHRVPFHVVGEGGGLHLVEVRDFACDSEAGHSSTVADATTARKDFAAMHSQFFGVKRYIGEVMSEVMHLRTEIQRELHTIKASVNKIAVQPVIRQILGSRVDATGERELNPPRIQRATVKLSKRPKDLFELWHEYEFGYAGVKPARDFTSVKRSANKFAHSRRKVFWDELLDLHKQGSQVTLLLTRYMLSTGGSFQ
ncbi:hypothetical protein PPTG_08711 [Phytophthora nicotianae INRA-310]|uniref:Uncharacterized protein n=1 Tax=Phytophthora nicotianae (strain INRA-310) TaxID=761204 RepID=W2QK30_PHYN3|nr:hypothetical protein PPTG_08711 [Phytophthora nicotianae INRA-310]ETN12610.1 hypothetical protein PPTG_08711 [Phytophthora nicotianae INRA-310]